MSWAWADASRIGFVWGAQIPGWCRPGLPSLNNMAGPLSIRAAIIDAWRDKVAAEKYGLWPDATDHGEVVEVNSWQFFHVDFSAFGKLG